MGHLINAQDEQRDGPAQWFQVQSRQPMLKFLRP
jgi:hypothetical protein